MKPTNRSQRGVSLIEALVAFGVMAFGMLAVVGMQGTLRTNGDLARQRAEAVRIGQDALEAWRSFTTLEAVTGRMAYANVATATASTVNGTNAAYTLRRVANDPSAVSGTVTPRHRALVVDVEWTDRAGQPQMIRLASALAGIEPEIAASLVLAANPDAVVSPLGRHRGIPRTAVNLVGVGSGFVPPGQPDSGTHVAWVFNNLTGVVRLCTTSGNITADLLTTGGAPDCTGGQSARLINGSIRFATDGVPTTSSITDPAGPDTSFGLSVAQTVPSTQTVTCYQEPLVDTQVHYYCAVPVTTDIPNWSGRLVFGAPLVIAASGGTSASEFKVCRYHAASEYSAVTTATLSQNFVIIKAGDGSLLSYECPTLGSPRTWAHQPS